MQSKKTLKVCSRCVSDKTVPGISFDTNGVCNYCHIHDKLEKEFPTGQEGQKKFLEIVEKIKKDGRHNKKYDCVVGVSGGCDSSYLIYKVKEAGLRPLAVHFDNTWNTEVATQNIQRVLKRLNIDLYTYVVDNEEYDDILRSFLKAGVKDIECPTDIGLIGTLYRAAEKVGVRYILDGFSFRTEGIVPIDWCYMDGKYVESVHKQFGARKMKTYPNLRILNWLRWMLIKKIKRVRLLNYIDYNKERVKKLLSEKFDWQWYGEKHAENRYTIFCDHYFWSKKFNMNFAQIELSGLVRSGQITKDEALRKMGNTKEFDTKEIIDLVKKRLSFSDQEFEKIMNLPKKTYRDYKTYKACRDVV